MEHYLTGSSTPFPFHKFSSVETLALVVLKRFSLRNLSSAAQLGTAAVIGPLEAAYENEFYRVLQQILGFSSKVVSEWSGANDNHVDFRIEEPGWGIEILREGNRLGEHCQRFVAAGRYTPWITKGLVKDWIVIDCRTSGPRQYSKSTTRLALS